MTSFARGPRRVRKLPTPEQLMRIAVHELYALLEDDNRHNECAMLLAVVYGDLDDQQDVLNIAYEHDVRGYLTESEAQQRAKIVAEVMTPFDT